MRYIDPWKVVFLAGLGAQFWIRRVYFQRAKRQKQAVSKFGTCERILLAMMFPPVIFLPISYLFTPTLAFADYRLPTLVPCIGAVTMAASLGLFWKSHADLGSNWSVSLELREGHQLITRGVYRYIRHPMYASIWLWGIAQGMLLQNWFAGWSVLPAFAVMYFIRVPREERMMLDAFGLEYLEYMRRTGRLIPRMRTKGSTKSGRQ